MGFLPPISRRNFLLGGAIGLLLQCPDFLWAEENSIRLPDNSDVLAEMMANSNWLDKIADLAKNIGKKLTFLFRDKDQKEKSLTLSFPRKLVGRHNLQLVSSDGTSRDLKFRDYFQPTSFSGGHSWRDYINLAKEHPLQVMLGALAGMLAAWFGAGIIMAIIHALAYIILAALFAAIVIWGVPKFGRFVKLLLERVGIPTENFDNFKRFFHWKKEEFKKYIFDDHALDWHSKAA